MIMKRLIYILFLLIPLSLVAAPKKKAPASVVVGKDHDGLAFQLGPEDPLA